MKKKLLMVLISVSMIASVFTGCGNSTEAKDSGKAQTEQADTKKRILQIRQMRSRQHWKTEHIQQNFRRTVLCSM